jgi:hypothetical protein
LEVHDFLTLPAQEVKKPSDLIVTGLIILRIVRQLLCEEFVLESHIGLWLQANAGAEDVGERSALLSKSINYWGAWWRKRSLEISVTHPG